MAARVRSLAVRGGENARDEEQRCEQQQDEEPDADARDERHRVRTSPAGTKLEARNCGAAAVEPFES
jgi:hypothetical protein